MEITPKEMTVQIHAQIHADTTEITAALDALSARLAELREEAEAIRKIQPEASAAVDAVIDTLRGIKPEMSERPQLPPERDPFVEI